MIKVYLGGTCNGSEWRDELIKKLKTRYFNPAGEQWTEEMKSEEIRQREICDFCLYVLTPKMEGYYSIAELVDDSNKRPAKTVFCFLSKDEGTEFSKIQLRSLEQLALMVADNGARHFKTLEEVADFLNSQ